MTSRQTPVSLPPHHAQALLDNRLRTLVVPRSLLDLPNPGDTLWVREGFNVKERQRARHKLSFSFAGESTGHHVPWPSVLAKPQPGHSPHELIPYDRNSRTHPAWQIAQIIASIEEFGFANPILIGEDNVIIAGHGRLAAAQQMGLEKVSVVKLGHLSAAQRRALVIADNKIAENAGWDEEMLRQELEALQAEAFDLDVLGFDMDELNALLDFEAEDETPPPAPSDPDHVPEPDPIYASEPGDVWILGDHRLLCGDSTSTDQVAILCDGFDVDCVWTDPPYNVNYEGTAGKIQNDDMSAADFRKFLVSAFMAAASVMRAGAPIYVAHADTEGLAFRKAFVDAGLKLSGCLIWEKPSLVLGRSDYQWRHEPILYGWKPGAAHSWYGARDKTTVVSHNGEAIRVQADGSVQISIGDQVVIIEGQNLSMRSVDTSIIRHEKPARNADHPTMKPVGLIERYLANSSQPGDIVLDLFGGSGSTLIACEKMGRKARLVEGAVADAFNVHPDYLTDKGRHAAVESVTKRVVGNLIGHAKETRQG